MFGEAKLYVTISKEKKVNDEYKITYGEFRIGPYDKSTMKQQKTEMVTPW